MTEQAGKQAAAALLAAVVGARIAAGVLLAARGLFAASRLAGRLAAGLFAAAIAATIIAAAPAAVIKQAPQAPEQIAALSLAAVVRARIAAGVLLAAGRFTSGFAAGLLFAASRLAAGLLFAAARLAAAIAAATMVAEHLVQQFEAEALATQSQAQDHRR
jgi:hypothetical protein